MVGIGNRGAQEITEQRHAQTPERTADDIEGEKRFVLHVADAGDDGGKGAHDRNKARENDRLAAMLFIIVLGIGDMAFFKKS